MISGVKNNNMRRIIEIANEKSSKYLDLPAFLAKFSYPVSLQLAESVGCKVYQKGFADALEFVCIMVSKYYTNIRHSDHHKITPIVEKFIIWEGEKIKERTKALISTVKKWEVGNVGDRELGNAIDEFCNCYGVGLPLVSFFLRMLLPEKFGTLDKHVINALKSLGFEVYVHDGFSYLLYNELLKEIGRHYKIPSRTGGMRCLTPSEVDMALYQYDKERGNKGNVVLSEKEGKNCLNALFEDAVWDENINDYEIEETAIEDLPNGFEDILHPEGEGDYNSDIDYYL